MEQNHFRWITLLDTHADGYALGDGEPAELRQKIHPFTRTPIESDVKGNGKHKAQLSALRLRERETVLKRCQTGIGEIDGALNARKIVHNTSITWLGDV